MSFDTSEGNQLSYFQNCYFYKIIWLFHDLNNQVKKLISFLSFSDTNEFFVDTFVTIEYVQTRYMLKMDDHGPSEIGAPVHNYFLTLNG